MMRSTSQDKTEKKNKKIRVWPILVWLVLWQFASMAVGQEILLVSPVFVVQKLGTLVQEKFFWTSILYSMTRILSGFALGVAAGIFFSMVAAKYKWMEDFLAPAVFAIKSIPVASFIIVALVWVSSKNLSILLSFLMCFPILYSSILEGIRQTDSKLLEMAEVYQIPFAKKLYGIYIPQVLPYFTSAATVAAGLSWKSGIAAEVIGIPRGSIGERLYNAKIYLNTPELFAWTVVIIFISVAFEKLFLLLIKHGTVHRIRKQRSGRKCTQANRAEDTKEQEPIRVEKICFSYGEKTVLKDFSHVFLSENTCIMGISGGGKTTLLSVLIGTATPDSGSISGIQGKKIAVVFQEDRLVEEFSCYENLRLVAPEAEQKIIPLLDELGLEDSIHKPVKELSGGMERRTAIARALIVQPDLLFLDEAFKGLDVKTKSRVMQIVKEKMQGRRIISITHEKEEAAYFNAEEIEINRYAGTVE